MVWKPDLCIYHGSCDDGFGAAWAVWRKWPDVQFIPGKYGEPALDGSAVAGKHVLFVDFSYARGPLDNMAQDVASIVIIDHHKTAESALAPFKVEMCGGASLNPNDINGMFRDLAELNRPPIIAWFDMTQSGAVMAWEFCHGIPRNDPPPTMLALIQDRDLWTFAFGDRTKRFSAALRTYPMDFEVWDGIAKDPEKLVAEGESILRAHLVNIGKFMEDAFEEEIGGYRVPCCNVPYHYASDTANELLARFPEAPFAAAWFKRGDGLFQTSLRSTDDRVDVSEIAKQYGGGGHRNAAGFQVGSERAFKHRAAE